MFFLFDTDEKLENLLNKTNLEYIIIKGLFGKNNIKLSFEKEVNIYVGENGLGKTTILNCVYHILQGYYRELADIDFSEISVKIKGLKEKTISKSDVCAYVFDEQDAFDYTTRKAFSILNLFTERNLPVNLEFYNILEQATIFLSQRLDIPINLAEHYVNRYMTLKHSRGNEKNVSELSKYISDNLNLRILYLPTYRRIERDFSDYFSEERHNRQLRNDMLIRFGMKDVSFAIEKLLGEVQTRSNTAFSSMTGKLLSRYSNGNNNYDDTKSFKYDLKKLEIVLNRLGRI